MSMTRFIPVGEIVDPLTVTLGLSGASGTGKTYSSLLVGRGMAEAVGGKGAAIGYVDTENRRALHYRGDFPEMMHFDMKAVDDRGRVVGFGPERWIEVIDAAEAAKLPVLVIDSFSHAWEGVGGVLDLQARTLERLTQGNDALKEKRSQLAWAEVKPPYRRLIDRIVRAQTNIIINTRAKPVMQDSKTKQNARDTKTRRKDIPWDPAADGDLMFEMTAMVILDPKAPGCPVHQVKVADQFKALFDARQPMGVETGRQMVAWARGQGEAAADKRLLDRARAEARKGRDAFTAFWRELGRDSRDQRVVATILDECQRLVSEEDNRRANPDDPFKAFGTAREADPEPTEEERDRAMREAQAAARANAEAEGA